MNKPSEDDIKFAEEISSYSPNKVTDVMKLDNEALQRYIEGNAQYLGGRPSAIEASSIPSDQSENEDSSVTAGFTARDAGYGVFALAIGAIFAGLLPVVTFRGVSGNIYGDLGLSIYIHFFHFYFLVIAMLGINEVIDDLKGWITPAVIAVTLVFIVYIIISLTGGVKVGFGFIVMLIIYLLIQVLPFFVNSKVKN